MLCRILRSNPHRGGVASRPGYPESGLDEETRETESEREHRLENSRHPAEAEGPDEEPSAAQDGERGG